MSARADKKPLLLFVVGPTACGKSDLAVEISERVRDELGRSQPDILNTDSVAFFEAVQIGAAKPGPELLARASHHLIGHVKKNDKYTAGDFRRDALAVLAAHLQADFVAVGGSGFYVQALEKGMFDVPAPPDDVKSGLERDQNEKGMLELYNELGLRDSEAQAKIKPNDHYRILRALEILRGDSAGRRLSEIRASFEAQRPPQPFRASKIGLFRPRDILRQKVTERTRRMLKAGLIEEVEHLRSEGLHTWSPMLSVGYKEVQAFLDGQLPKSELESAIVTSTMQVAKSQMTWFKRDQEIRWFDTDTSWNEAKLEALKSFSRD